MKTLLALALLAAAASSVDAEVVGSITLATTQETLYIWRQFGDVSVSGDAVTVRGNSRAYVLKNNVVTITPEDYYQMPLSNRHFSYNVDLSSVPCHCNAAAYFASMPAYDGGDGLDYYCDANYVGGIGCPEYDTLEANKHIVSGALHECGWDGSWWTGCDGGGCGSNTWDNADQSLGQGKTIDTSKPFLISHFQKSDQSNIWMQQEGREVSFDICYGNSGYTSGMDAHWQEGMVLIFSQWGASDHNEMGWLDDKTGCQPENGVAGCDINNAQVVFSGFDLWEEE